MRYSIPSSFRDLDASALSPELLAQVKLSVLLGYGFALSLLGTGGLGSLAALVIGLVAWRRVRASGGRLAGVRVAWWCIIAGALGVLLSALVISESFDRISDSLRR